MRYMVTDPTRPTDPELPGDPNTFHDGWAEVEDELGVLNIDPPTFGNPVQVEDGNVTLTITCLE